MSPAALSAAGNQSTGQPGASIPAKGEMMPQLIPARTYMQREIEDHRDLLTDDVNATTLAEDTCNALNLWDGDVPDWLYDLAADVAWRDEQRRQPGAYCPAAAGYINRRPSTEI